ncbi:MAG: TROVE domain-containing protein [Desulfurellales bacterium]|nr:MAG: TROVE domain-containing protein [Desulfurellales bacterium]
MKLSYFNSGDGSGRKQRTKISQLNFLRPFFFGGIMRFNATSKGTETTNLAGGSAYSESPELELVSILLTSFVSDKFYRSASAEMTRIKELVGLIKDKKFVAKAALYARHEAGMRSISHVVAAEVAAHAKGELWTKAFFKQIVKRPDDMAEILSCYRSQYGKAIPNCMKKGFRARLESLDDYAAGKYQMTGKTIKLVDLVNLLHPKATPTLTKLIKGKLKSVDTWEVALSEAGQKATDDESLESLKADAWHKLISTKKLGYFALVRNLRNIMMQAANSLPAALGMLVDPVLIKKSGILPFQYMTAVEAIKSSGQFYLQDILKALNAAIEIALNNIPELPGRTCVAVDVSGSMAGKPLEIATLFGAALYKRLNCSLILFSDRAGFVQIPNFDSLLTITEQLRTLARQMNGGTKFPLIFAHDKPFDRLIILSDMQAWGDVSTKSAYKEWKKRTGSDPKVFSIDLAGAGSLQFPERNCYALAGWSEKIFDVIAKLEADKAALIATINAVTIAERKVIKVAKKSTKKSGSKKGGKKGC